MYYRDISHAELGKFRRVTGTDSYVVEQRVSAQLQIWNDQWQRRCEIEQKRSARQNQINRFETNKTKAARLTAEAQESVEELRSLLLIATARKLKFDWNSLYDRRSYPEPKPHVPAIPPGPVQPRPAAVPELKLSFWAKIFPSIRRRQEEVHRRALETARVDFEKAQQDWEKAVREAAKQIDELHAAYESLLAEWESGKAAFEDSQREANAKADAARAKYMQKDRDAVIEYVDSILERAEYPDVFPKQWQMDLVQESGVMIVDYELPSLDAFPKLKSVKFVQSRDALEERYLRDSEIAQIYDSAMYQTCLRTLHEVFETDEANAINSVTFNGWVNFIDKSNGRPARSCIMSLQATKEVFEQIKLGAVDPKTCFRTLKGVGSAKLAGMAAVVPILRLNREDARFVPSHDVIESVVESTNIAAIPWEEFEYLVRDLFEKVFSANGGEVKITRASRDHGVDAIAFDPDPIRGGKIVIQAKRYTNLVGVSAVRDLYGTLINEGANRGILVTTSQFGADSFNFAKDKPITLLDGGNLLSLLDQHGHKARIDLAEAKKLGLAREER